VILDQARRGVGIEALDVLPVADVNLILGDHRRHRDDQREIGQLPLVVIRHRDNGPVSVSNQDNLRCVVEQGCVGLADVETAEGVRCTGWQRQHRRDQ